MHDVFLAVMAGNVNQFRCEYGNDESDKAKRAK